MADFPMLSSNENGSPTLVCLPYFGGSARSFEALWPLLPASWSLRAYTLRGIGVENGAYSVEQGVAQLAQAIARDVSGPFHLVGHSMGGKFALGLAASGLPGLQSVVLLAPSPPSPEPMSDEGRQGMLARHGTREGALETLRRASHLPLSPELVEHFIEDDLNTREDDWRNWLERGSREDCSVWLAQVKVPVRVLVGEHDGAMTLALMEEAILEPLRALLVPTELEVIAGSGHLLPLEAPGEVARWLTRWVS